MIEGQQTRIETAPDGSRAIDLRVDSGPLQARRILERLIADELSDIASAAE